MTLPKINVLQKKIAELIAAGEVIDRPASVIKELIENSIDSGADSITVEIKNGGITFMRVSDNGCGIQKDDMRNAFLRHATSKVKEIGDLYKIGTLGFRGEALSSIAAMCKVELLSREKSHDYGAKYVIEGGDEISFEEIGCPVGTTIIVRDIFYNTPARMKFLKKDVSEGNAVSIIVDKIALSHPEVSIKFIRDGKIKMTTLGDKNMLSSIYEVMGKDFAQSLLAVNYNSMGIKVEGFISKPSACKSNRRTQNFFINSRYIKTVTGTVAVEEAYKHSKMIGKMPACVINICMPYDLVDVNVHPSKIEVRFTNEKPIFNAIYSACKNTLTSYSNLNEVSNQNITTKKCNTNMFTLTDKNINSQQQKLPVYSYTEDKNDDKQIEDFSVQLIDKQTHRPASNILGSSKTTMPYFSSEEKKSICVLPPKNKDSHQIIVHHMKSKMLDVFKEQDCPSIDIERNNDVKNIKQEIPFNDKEKCRFDDFQIVGELFDTYIILQDKSKAIFIDKHAAHERIIFEKLKRDMSNNTLNRQILLSPLTIRLSQDLYSIAIKNVKIFKNMGFLIDDFGGETIIIREIPMILQKNNIEDVIINILDNIDFNKNDITPQLYDDLLHSIACRSAIKGNDKNNKLELEKIIELLNKYEDIQYCPHGRPISIAMTKYQIEKKFGRV